MEYIRIIRINIDNEYKLLTYMISRISNKYYRVYEQCQSFKLYVSSLFFFLSIEKKN